MSQTKEFAELKKELKIIKTAYIPREFSATGVYTERQREHVRAYYVFCHAAIEEYLENVVRRVLDDSFQKLKTAKIITTPIMALSVWCIPSDKQFLIYPKVHRKADLIVRIEKMIDQFKSSLDGNHGIKEENIRNLVCPIGVNFSSLDATWLATMSDFGSKRGLAAHASGKSFATNHRPDPKTAVKDVDNLIAPLGGRGLKLIDETIKNLVLFIRI